VEEWVRWVSATLRVTLVAGKECLTGLDRIPEEKLYETRGCQAEVAYSPRTSAIVWTKGKQCRQWNPDRTGVPSTSSLSYPRGPTKRWMYPHGNLANTRSLCRGLEMLWYQLFLCCRSAISLRNLATDIPRWASGIDSGVYRATSWLPG
jgi:hypothetical protein